MDLIRQWIVGITCAAMIAALAEALAPEGSVKKAGRLAGGLLLMLAVVRPLVGLDYGALAGSLSQSRLYEAGYAQVLEEKNIELMKAIIEEQTAAYISDKAGALGMDCTAQVTYHYGEDGQIWPESVVVRGVFTDSQRESLTRAIEVGLAVPEENQLYERTDSQ